MKRFAPILLWILSACGQPLEGQLKLTDPNQPLRVHQPDLSVVQLQDGNYSLKVDKGGPFSDPEIVVLSRGSEAARMAIPERGKKFNPRSFSFRSWEIHQEFDLKGRTNWENERFTEREYIENCDSWESPWISRGSRRVLQKIRTVDEVLRVDFLEPQSHALQANFEGSRTHEEILREYRGPCTYVPPADR